MPLDRHRWIPTSNILSVSWPYQDGHIKWFWKPNRRHRTFQLFCPAETLFVASSDLHWSPAHDQQHQSTINNHNGDSANFSSVCSQSNTLIWIACLHYPKNASSFEWSNCMLSFCWARVCSILPSRFYKITRTHRRRSSKVRIDLWRLVVCIKMLW